MANSSIVSVMKDKITKEIINDKNLFYAINSPTYQNPNCADDLINTHIFRYHQNPDTLDKAITFITLQVHTAKSSRYNSQDIWIRPTLEIWIISHESCMAVKNIPKITSDRNDYISQLLDDKFNGRTSLGTEQDKEPLKLLGKLDLVENSEGALTQDYLYRKLIFVTRDINDSMCDRW